MGISNDLTCGGGQSADESRRTYTVLQAARLAGIGKNSMYESARHGEVPVIRIGKRLLIPKAAFDRLLENGRKLKWTATIPRRRSALITS